MSANINQLLEKFITVQTGGPFISFEGIEGSGKSTQIQLFKKNLESEGKNVLLLREPGGTDFGEALRNAILSSKVALEPIAEAMLMASSRAQLLRERIIPFLDNPNSLVIVDRYIDSSIAYQGNARGLGIDKILQLHQYPPLNNLPDITFYLKIDLELSMKRQLERGNQKDYFESKGKQFYIDLIDGYEKAAKIFPERIKIINGNDTVDNIQKNIVGHWNKFKSKL